MLKPEVEHLFSLLGMFYPNAQQLKSKPLQAAWVMALEPFAYDDAKAAVIAYARKNKFWPDVSDITADLPEIHTEVKIKDDVEDKRRVPGMLDAIKIFYGKFSAKRSDAYHSAGVPTWTEARENGMPWIEWIAQCRKAFHGHVCPAGEYNGRFCNGG